MAELHLEAPNPKQAEFLRARARFINYGGARGGGKSWGVRAKASLLSLRFPGIRELLLRRTYPELKENHVLPLRKLLKDIAVYKESDKVFEFPNGSRLKLGYLDSESDVLQYQGQEYDVIFLDEATQFTEFQFNTLTACLRGANNFPKRMYLTCNPGGVGHAWVKRLFIDRQYRNNEKPEDYVFIPARVYDNKALLDNDTGYVQMLENLPENMRRAWLEGDWNVFDGQYFPEFRDDIHVCEPFSIPNDWVRYTAMDYGLDMLAHYWIAISPDNTAYVYRELYESGVIVSEAVKKIREREDSGEQIYSRIAPPDLWNAQSATGKSTALLFDEAGLALDKANNDRISGWLAIKELLKVEDRLQPNGAKIKTSRLKIFRTCPNLIRTLPLLQYDEKKVNDAATEPHEVTHAPDALRYFAISWTYPAAPQETQKQNTLPWALQDEPRDYTDDFSNDYISAMFFDE